MLGMLPEYMISLCNDTAVDYGGLLLFHALVKIRCGGYETILADEYMSITGSQIGNIKSLFIKPLERKIREEYGKMENVQEVNMKGMCRTQHRTPLLLEVKLENRPPVSLDFWLMDGMLYVPKRR